MTDEAELDNIKEAWVEKRRRIRGLNIRRIFALVIQAVVSLASVFILDTNGSIIVIIGALAFAELYNLYIGIKISHIIKESSEKLKKVLDELESKIDSQQISVIGETRGDGHP
jgi:hypothetical protein